MNYLSNESNIRNANMDQRPSPQGYLPPYQQHPSLLGSNDNNNVQSTSDPPSKNKSRSRMRVSRACDRCRNHKIKCTGTNPCSTCIRQKKECSYSSNALLASREEPPMKKQRVFPLQTEPFGLPQVNKATNQEYISHLENRVQYLESLLTENSNTVYKEPQSQEPEIDSVINTIFSTSSKWRFSRRHQNLLIVELCRSMYANLSEESKQMVTIPRTQYFGWNMSGVNYIKSESLPEKPSFDINSIKPRELIDYFFIEINPLFAILHETVFREQFEAYIKIHQLEKQDEEKKSDTKQCNDSKTNQTKLFSAILYLVLALSIRFSEFQKQKGPSIENLKLEEQLFKYGYKVVSILSFEWESFELIQSWLLIALYLRVTHRQTSCSHALNQAVMMTKSMGLGFDEENPKILISTNYERLKAQRIFWCVFTFDRVFGLQTGRYCGFRDEDFSRKFPSYDYFQQGNIKDDWLTLPALALILIARISNFIHTLPNDNPHLVKYQQINAELVKLNDWFNEVGFRNDLLYKVEFNNDGTSMNNYSSLIRSQVKLHYYDLVMCIHGKVLFNYIGKRIASHGLKVELVIDACFGVIDVLDKTNKAGLLYTPWYSNLLLLFNIGVNAITIINGGVFIEQSRTILKNAIRLLNLLKKSPVRNEMNKLIFRERFKMVKECTWALKMANKILTLRLKEDIDALNNIGVDHGSSDVNLQTFSQLGKLEQDQSKKIFQAHSNNDKNNNNNKMEIKVRRNIDEDKSKSGNEFSKVFEKQLYRNEEVEVSDEEEEELKDDLAQKERSQFNEVRNNNKTNVLPAYHQHDSGNGTPMSNESSEINQSNSLNQDIFNSKGYEDSYDIDNLLGNIQWFDQWIDFNYEV